MTTDRQPRRQLHGYVSDTARDGWYEFAERHGTNVTALLEAVGTMLADNKVKPAAALPPLLRAALKDAQAIASSRSTRRRN